MITLDLNNFGGGSVILKDYQSNSFCVLNGKITIDPTNSAYIAAERLELDLPEDFSMKKSAISSAILVSIPPAVHNGTVLRCWIEDNKLCIEKLTYFDSLGNYDIYINSAFVSRGYRGSFTQTQIKNLSCLSTYNLFSFDHCTYVETDDYIYLAALFKTFPFTWHHGHGPFTVQLSGFAADVSLEIPLFVQGGIIPPNSKGSKITVGILENGNLTFSYPAGDDALGGENCFFIIYAIRNNINSI